MMPTLLTGDELTIHSCQLRGCYRHPEGWCPHFAVPGRYIVERIDPAVKTRIVYLRRIDIENETLFRCTEYDIAAIFGEWTNFKKAGE